MQDWKLRPRHLRAAATAALSFFPVVFALWLLPRTGLLVIEHGPRESRQIALTFDADMTKGMEERLRSGKVGGWFDSHILSTLEEESVPATFFITGLWARNYPEIVKRLSQNPLFEIGNHSFSHAAFSRPCYNLPRARHKTREITEAQDILYRLTGQAPTLFRFPGGCYSVLDVARVRLLGLKDVEYDIISTDAFSTDREAIVTHVLETTQNGSIIIMHLSGPPNAPQTAQALPPIIKGLRERGFSFVTVSQLLASTEKDPL